MPKVVFGVIDLPYSHTENLGKNKSGKRKGQARASTTGDVAEILEAKYEVMQTFWNLHQDEIVNELHESLADEFDAILQGKPLSNNAFAGGTSEIETMFKKFLSEKEMDGLGVKGVPTKASLMGVSHRFKDKKGTPGRPSFIDTGMYENAFKAWVE